MTALKKEIKAQIRTQLLAELSRKNTDLIAQWLEEHPGYQAYFLELILGQDEKLSMRAAWALDVVNSKGKLKLQKTVHQLLPHIPTIPFPSTRRCLSKLLMRYPIAPEFEGEILDYCIRSLEDPDEPVAIKANNMTVIFNLIPKYPELQAEIFSLIEHLIPQNSAGFQSRYKVLKQKMKRK